jgi:hypothetical protein
MSKTIKLIVICAVLALTSTQALAFKGNGQPNQASGSNVQMASLEGKVVETMNAGGYTYVCIKQGEQKAWAAVPATKVAVGSEVAVTPGMVMTNFSSKSLGRTFDAIVFSRGLTKK